MVVVPRNPTVFFVIFPSQVQFWKIVVYSAFWDKAKWSNAYFLCYASETVTMPFFEAQIITSEWTIFWYHGWLAVELALNCVYVSIKSKDRTNNFYPAEPQIQPGPEVEPSRKLDAGDVMQGGIWNLGHRKSKLPMEHVPVVICDDSGFLGYHCHVRLPKVSLGQIRMGSHPTCENQCHMNHWSFWSSLQAACEVCSHLCHLSLLIKSTVFQGHTV